MERKGENKRGRREIKNRRRSKSYVDGDTKEKEGDKQREGEVRES